ncbi:ATP-binding cassette, subfamily B [Streptomyces sp. 2231.1]|nr:ATP-binding cassette, subfamily B [Streptomyces sp. 2231.1]
MTLRADAADAPPTPSPAAVRDLSRAVLRHTGARCAALCAVSTAATAAGLLLPALLGHTLDLLLAHAPAARWVGGCAALVLLTAVLEGCAGVLTGTADARATAWLRHRLTGHVLALGPRVTARFGSGDLVARLVGGAAQAGTAPGALAALAAALAGPVGGVIALGLIDRWLAAVFLVGAPVLALLLRAFARDTSACAADYQRVQGRIASSLADAVGGFRTIRAAGAEDRETARILAPLPELSRAGHRMWRVQGRAAAQAVTVAPLLTLGVVAVAGLLLVRHRLTVGEVLAASRYAALATGVGVLVGQLAALGRARAATARLAEVTTEGAPAHGARRLPSGPGRLELRGVTAHRGARTVLDGVDLVVPGGTTLAVVGRSGTGKSLLAELAGRLADPDAGEVLLDGVPLPELSHAQLRQAVAYAFERPALLGTTVADTIAFGLAAPSPAGVRAAARKARADAFVRRLPAGYATRCADAPRSGGESQRLGLARAFAHGGRLLVLDDALSSLDTVTEHQITRSLLGPGPTRLLIAHRATTAARADTVAWLDGGRVRAIGTHHELWADADYRAVFGEENGTEAEGARAEGRGVGPAPGTPEPTAGNAGAGTGSGGGGACAEGVGAGPDPVGSGARAEGVGAGPDPVGSGAHADDAGVGPTPGTPGPAVGDAGAGTGVGGEGPRAEGVVVGPGAGGGGTRVEGQGVGPSPGGGGARAEGQGVDPGPEDGAARAENAGVGPAPGTTGPADGDAGPGAGGGGDPADTVGDGTRDGVGGARPGEAGDGTGTGGQVGPAESAVAGTGTAAGNAGDGAR